MKLYTLRRSQKLSISVEKAWEFLSDPYNLARITPPELGLIPQAGGLHAMYEGMIISYNIRPFAGTILSFIPALWVTEIIHVKAPYYFVDEQRMGPYKFWHHQHFIHEDAAAQGVTLEDIVHYALPCDPFSRPVHALIVQPMLERIFNFRVSSLEGIMAT